jgi:2-hydroxy-6-oxonona-2,4-dienedioate hydrolase
MNTNSFQDRYIYVDGVKTRYWEQGDSEKVLVLVHGFAASVEYWESNIKPLSKHYRVIALDMIGFGKTDKPKVNYDITLLANFLKKFLMALKLKKIYLAGHSLGGGICLQFTLSFPKQVERLILVSSVGFNSKLPWSFRLLSMSTVGRFLKYFSVNSKSQKKLLQRFVYNKNAITDSFAQKMNKILNGQRNKEIMLEILHNHVNLLGIRKSLIVPIQQRFVELALPILIIWGKQDNLLTVEGAYTAKRLIAASQIEVFPQCGHMPQIEYPIKFNDIAQKFISFQYLTR